MIRSILISLAIHLSIFMLGKGGLSDKNDVKAGGIKDKPSEKNTIKVSVVEVRPIEEKSKIAVDKKKKKKIVSRQEYQENDCENHYSGIGVVYEGMGDSSCVVEKVGVGYPAYRAGIRAGDVLLHDEDGGCPGRGPLKSLAVIRVMRNGEILTFEMYREKICSEI